MRVSRGTGEPAELQAAAGETARHAGFPHTPLDGCRPHHHPTLTLIRRSTSVPVTLMGRIMTETRSPTSRKISIPGEQGCRWVAERVSIGGPAPVPQRAGKSWLPPWATSCRLPSHPSRTATLTHPEELDVHGCVHAPRLYDLRLAHLADLCSRHGGAQRRARSMPAAQATRAGANTCGSHPLRQRQACRHTAQRTISPEHGSGHTPVLSPVHAAPSLYRYPPNTTTPTPFRRRPSTHLPGPGPQSIAQPGRPLVPRSLHIAFGGVKLLGQIPTPPPGEEQEDDDADGTVDGQRDAKCLARGSHDGTGPRGTPVERSPACKQGVPGAAPRGNRLRRPREQVTVPHSGRA